MFFSHVEPSTETSNGHLDLTSQIVEYELVTQDTSTNQHKPDVGAGLKNRNDDAAQYEDIKGPDTTERVPNTYESLPDEVRHRLRVIYLLLACH